MDVNRSCRSMSGFFFIITVADCNKHEAKITKATDQALVTFLYSKICHLSVMLIIAELISIMGALEV